MINLDHRPIQEEYREKMNRLAKLLDEYFNPNLDNKTTAFVLLIAPFGDDPEGRVNYISNGRRQDMKKMMTEVIKRWGGEGNKKKLSVDDIELIMRAMDKNDFKNRLTQEIEDAKKNDQT
jgi:hypothetical protein